MPLGYSDLKNVLRISGNWDLAYMKQWELADGTTFDTVVSRVAASISLFNGSLSSGYWSQFLRTTEEDAVEYPIGGETAQLELISEYSRPDPIHGEFTGHMLPLEDRGGALGWTYMALRRANMSRIDLDIRRLIERANNTWEIGLLNRAFSSAATTVGSTGVSVPFADGGTADSTYVPPSFKGQNFASSHNHFLRYTDDAAGRTAALKAMAGTMKEHGTMGPWDLIIPEVDQALWTAQAEFVKPDRAAILSAGVTERAVVNEDTYIGVIEVDDGWFRVKTETRLPQNYAGAFKPYGFNSPQNPLVVRYEPGYPMGLSLVATPKNFPLQDAVAYFTNGFGIANRLGGTATHFAATGSYVDPTIS